MTMMQGLPLTGVPVSAIAKKRGEIWFASCQLHVKSMHRMLASIYDSLESDVYDDFSDNDNGDVDTKDGDTTKLAESFADRSHRLITLLREPTSVAVELPLSGILSVLTRCLKVSHSDVLSVPSRSDLIPFLPSLHQCCMDVLSHLILCCGGDILSNSHLVVDLCLQTITSAKNMDASSKCRTRASAYQALVLWIRTCGWGKYLTSHSKILIQELIADTQADSESKLATKSQDDGGKEKFGGKGRKHRWDKKRRRKGDSYKDLEVLVDAMEKAESNQERLDTALQAFSLSQLAIEHLPFSASQSLMSHMIQTASSVQRLFPSCPKPYCYHEARQGLYQTLSSCLRSSLDFGCNRNDAVSHYRMTNAALDHLARACHREEMQVQAICCQALDILRASGNMKGPVIRKVLDYEDSGVEDVGQLLREKEEMADCVDDLRHKLMNSEVENEQQARLISDLRKELASLQDKVSSGIFDTKEKGTAKVNEDKEGMESEEEEESDEEVEEEMNKAEQKTVKESRPSSSTTENCEQGREVEKSMSGFDGVKTKVKDTGKHSVGKKEDVKIASNTLPVKASHGAISKKKRVTMEEEDSLQSKEAKRPKLDEVKDAGDKQGSCIEDMLQDFVDAPPDS